MSSDGNVNKHAEKKGDLQVQSPRVAILLSTYNGERFLKDQLDSFASQTHKNWKVFASDDGSKDKTNEILLKYKDKWGEGRLSVYTGPKKGYAENFYSLICNPAIREDYYAYSDQDDVWSEKKLQRALSWLKVVPKKKPALYCSRTISVDAKNVELGMSPLFSKPPLFTNALIQNIAGGNTMVFNEAAARLIRYGGNEIDITAHDWWTYLVVTGAGGEVFYDPMPSVRYRQHGQNLIGANVGFVARFFRIRDLFDGKAKRWADNNINALQVFRPMLTSDNQERLDRFISFRKQKLLLRLVGLKRSGVYRQTLMGNIGLLVGVMFRRI